MTCGLGANRNGGGTPRGRTHVVSSVSTLCQYTSPLLGSGTSFQMRAGETRGGGSIGGGGGGGRGAASKGRSHVATPVRGLCQYLGAWGSVRVGLQPTHYQPRQPEAERRARGVHSCWSVLLASRPKRVHGGGSAHLSPDAGSTSASHSLGWDGMGWDGMGWDGMG